METLLSICVGIGLSAACGFRIFVPLLAMSIAAQAGMYTPAPPFAWVGTTPALVAFAVATALEIAAYYIPWVDNLLDTVAAPAAVVAGVVATGASLDQMHPMLAWALAIIGGGGAAGTVQAGTSLLRAASSTTTGGLGNPLVATAEFGGATTLTLLAFYLPFVAAIAVAALVALVLWGGIRLRRRLVRA